MLKDFKQNSAVPVITIDGPSGAGKGTVSALIAKRLGWHFLDSGAIYRCLAYLVRKNSLSLTDMTAIRTLAQQLKPDFKADDHNLTIMLDGEDVTHVIRAELIGHTASKISADQGVRDGLLICQRHFASMPGLVADGRDMGTVVFPQASLKVFLDASPAERAKRRYLQMQAAGKTADIEVITENIKNRDARDRERSCAPLLAATDCVTIDTTLLSISDVVGAILAEAKVRDLITAGDRVDS